MVQLAFCALWKPRATAVCTFSFHHNYDYPSGTAFHIELPKGGVFGLPRSHLRVPIQSDGVALAEVVRLTSFNLHFFTTGHPSDPALLTICAEPNARPDMNFISQNGPRSERTLSLRDFISRLKPRSGHKIGYLGIPFGSRTLRSNAHH